MAGTRVLNITLRTHSPVDRICVCGNEWFGVSEVIVLENAVLTLTKPLLFEVFNLHGLCLCFEDTITEHWAPRTRNEGQEMRGLT